MNGTDHDEVMVRWIEPPESQRRRGTDQGKVA